MSASRRQINLSHFLPQLDFQDEEDSEDDASTASTLEATSDDEKDTLVSKMEGLKVVSVEA